MKIFIFSAAMSSYKAALFFQTANAFCSVKSFSPRFHFQRAILPRCLLESSMPFLSVFISVSFYPPSYLYLLASVFLNYCYIIQRFLKNVKRQFCYFLNYFPFLSFLGLNLSLENFQKTVFPLIILVEILAGIMGGNSSGNF